MRQVRAHRRTSAVTGLGLAVSAALVATAGALPTSASASVPAPSSAPAASALAAAPAGAPAGVRAATGSGSELDELTVPETPAASLPPGRVSGPTTVAELPETGTAAFKMIGVTWAYDEDTLDASAQVRTRTDGVWSDWQDLGGDEMGISSDGASPVRSGSDPLWVREADGVAARVVTPDGDVPEDVKVALIDPTIAAPSEAQRVSETGAGRPITGSPRFPKLPPLVTRRQWGSDPTAGDSCFAPIYGENAKAVIVHHTAGVNDYTRAESASIVRGIQQYHTGAQGWCDVGYNFLVDKFGTIYEGRKGGFRRPVRGAHSGDYNVDTVGISMMGNYDTRRLTPSLKNAMVRLIAWRLGTSYTPVRGKVFIYDHKIDRISGHRDVMDTACPGRFGYAWLPRARTRVEAYLKNFNSAIQRKRRTLSTDVTGPVFVGEQGVGRGKGRVTKLQKGYIYNRQGVGAHWLPRGPFLSAYRSQGGPRKLGFPMTDVRRTTVRGITKVVTQRGRIILSRDGRARVLRGPIAAKYVELGGVSSKLGLPTSSVRTIKDGERASFQRGTMTYDRRLGRVSVAFG